MSQTKGKILVIRGGAIGDFILTFPALAALREQFPETHIELLGYPHIAQLALAAGFVNDLKYIEARALAGFFARYGSLDAQLSAYFASFNLIISYLYDPDSLFKDNVARCSKAQYIVGPHRPDDRARIHATEVFLQPLERLAIFNADAIPRLNLPDAVEILLPPGQWLAIHPGSGSEKKNWPERQWADLVIHLVERTNMNFLLVGGEAEGDRLSRLAALVPENRLQVKQSIPLVDLAQHLKLCCCFVGHDSGISHLAAAIGLRSLVLWGVTNMEVWKPRGDRVTVLQGELGLSQLPVTRVLTALMPLLEEPNSR